MTGTRLTSRRRFSTLGSLFWLLVAGLLVAIGLAQESPATWLVVAFGPAVLGLALWFTRPTGLSIEFTERGIDCEVPPLGLVPYETLEGVVVPRAVRADAGLAVASRSFPIRVRTASSEIVIPSRFQVEPPPVAGSEPEAVVDSAAILAFLDERVDPCGSRQVHHELSDYLAEQIERFGEGRVWTYCANPVRNGRRTTSRARAVCLAFLLTGIFWIGAHKSLPADEGEPLAGFGGMFVVGALLALLVLLVQRGRVPRSLKGWESAGLVIGPVGLALVQGPLKGEMTWDELRGVKAIRRLKTARKVEPMLPSLQLKFDGAMIPIPDIYDRPLPDIEARILEYWR